MPPGLASLGMGGWFVWTTVVTGVSGGTAGSAAGAGAAAGAGVGTGVGLGAASWANGAGIRAAASRPRARRWLGVFTTI
jgi:hypothetical protein